MFRCDLQENTAEPGKQTSGWTSMASPCKLPVPDTDTGVKQNLNSVPEEHGMI